MALRRVDTHVFPEHRAAVSADWLERVASAALDVVDPGGGAGVSVVVADDATLRELNRRFRGLDEVTDVLSFGARGEGEEAPDGPTFPAAPGEESIGEVVASLPQAERQARERGAPAEHELALLVVHGVLHLWGYEHGTPEETEAMQAVERTVLAALFGAEARA
ncbi:MAG: rRNA maturation RNase YbeY [Chloroflexota bacterium]|nr:rRNA maturation RNase YbeY [Chloroflexota bacterium]